MKILLTFLILFPFILSSQEIPTRGEIYNFDIGDEFHYYRSEPGDCYIFTVTRHTILDKSFSSTNDTVFYEIHKEKYFSIPVDWPVLDTFYEVSTFNIHYTDLLSPIEDASLQDSILVLEIDSIEWCDDFILQYSWCSNCDTYNVDVVINQYGVGLGDVYYANVQGSYVYLGVRMIYSNKINGEECGERDDRVVSINNEFINSIRLYPNPATDYLIIDYYENDFDKILCFDQSGRLVSDLNLDNNRLDISHLESGQYVLLFVKDMIFSSHNFNVTRF